MVKQQPQKQPKPEPKPEPPERRKQPPKQQPQTQVSQQRLTSGIPHKQATTLAAAVTKPVAASYLDNPPPRYPEKARLRKQEGTVLLDVRISTDGTSEDVRVLSSSGYALLDRAALEAVRQWRFVPAKRGSQLIEANVEVPIKFQIQRRRKL
jgi:protein TonB